MRAFGQWANAQIHLRVKYFTQTSDKSSQDYKPNTRCLEQTGLHLSQGDESNWSIPSALALWKYVDKRAWGGGGCLYYVFFCAAEVVGSRAKCSLSTSLHILQFQAKRQNKGRELSCCRGNEDRGTQHRSVCPQ